MGSLSAETPAGTADHGCGYHDYTKALLPSSTDNPSLERPDIPDIVIGLATQLAAAAAAAISPTSDIPQDASMRPGGDSGNEADDPDPLPKSKLRRRSTGGTTHHARQPRTDSWKRGRGPGSSAPGQATPPDVMSLRPNEEVDGYGSEADMSGVDDYYRPKRLGPSGKSDTGFDAPSERWSGARSSRSKSKGIAIGDSSGCSDGGACDIGGKPEVFDSDLESEIGDVGKAAHNKKMRKWKSLAKGQFEKMLLECIVNTEEIPPNYENIHIDPKVIAKLERVTRLSLRCPKAFGHGVLAGNKVTGAVLWGPPGTGKSLLAKAVARQSGFNMILASTAELWQKCHGDDEKVIKALFSMARKIHPTIVFIDEADAMLGSRKAGEKRHIRAMLNQFLMEWDGLASGKDTPFILLATNRPFDLDPAVLRRAPMQIQLDIPTPAQRQGILKLILKDENLAPDVSIEKLAKLTSRYTGSDLKNMCVTAATECVWELKEDSQHRIIHFRHFKSAMDNIKATALTKTMQHELRSFGKGDGSMGQARQRDDE
ncbi:spastin [Podospora aff. communis PSN243]|uniref:Spastin n=1 Tax=Podospora aff. communis PSN243 TaxID=3040156 RepID=A0AAV9GCX4_9PEZI|nr:spastin [Podospora aff. communis PSN243]